MSLLEQELLILPDFTPGFCVVRVPQYYLRFTASDYRFDICKFFCLTPNKVDTMEAKKKTKKN